MQPDATSQEKDDAAAIQPAPTEMVADDHGAAAPEARRMTRKERKANDKRDFVSRGEKITNFGTYAGVDWLLNAAAGVKFAHWGERTEQGHRLWSKPINGFFERTLKPLIKDEALLATSISRGNMFMSIIAGGMATIPPLLVLENNKVKKSIVKSIDKMIYGKDAVENDPKFQKAYQEIDEAPKKKFWTGMYTRFMALAPCLAVVLIPETNKLSKKYYFEPLANGTKWASEKVGIQPKKLMEVNPKFGNSDWDYIHASLAMDFGLGPFYAAMHSFFYNMCAGKPKAIHEVKEGTQPIAPAVVVAPKDEAVQAKKQELPETPKPVIAQDEGRIEHHATVAAAPEMLATV